MLILFLPYHLLLMLISGRYTPKSCYFVFFVSAVPAVIALFYSIIFHGDQATVKSICDSLLANAPQRCETGGAISWLAKDIDFNAHEAGIKDFILYIIAIVLGLLPFLLIGLSQRGREIYRLMLTHKRSLYFALASSLSLFAVAVDYGRWINIIFISITLIMAFAYWRSTNTDQSHDLPKVSRFGVTRFINYSPMFYLFVFIYASSWGLKHYCCGGVNAFSLLKIIKYYAYG
jgi:hypothetical protein